MCVWAKPVKRHQRWPNINPEHTLTHTHAVPSASVKQSQRTNTGDIRGVFSGICCICWYLLYLLVFAVLCCSRSKMIAPRCSVIKRDFKSRDLQMPVSRGDCGLSYRRRGFPVRPKRRPTILCSVSSSPQRSKRLLNCDQIMLTSTPHWMPPKESWRSRAIMFLVNCVQEFILPRYCLTFLKQISISSPLCARSLIHSYDTT